MCARTALVASALCAVLLFGGASALAAGEQEIELALAVGEQQVISSEGVKSYSEGVKGVVDIRLTRDASSFVVVGLRPGSTTLLFLMLDGRQMHYRITVTGDAQVAPAPTEKEEDPERVQARDNIRLDFYFVQLSKEYGHQIGIGMPGSIGGWELGGSVDLMSGRLQEATVEVTGQVLPRLDIAQSAGWAKLLRQATVIAVNGSQASFGGGGEVNVPIQGALTAEVRTIAFGSNVKVSPRYDRESGRIELRLHADVSDLSSDNGTGVPGRVTSVLDTVVNLELGQSLVLAGLTARQRSHGTAGLPVLSRIPILGALFGSDGVRSQETENLIFIIPTVVDAVPARGRALVRKALRTYREYYGDLEEVTLVEPAAAGERKAGRRGRSR